jgi:hypothetical protein
MNPILCLHQRREDTGGTSLIFQKKLRYNL